MYVKILDTMDYKVKLGEIKKFMFENTSLKQTLLKNTFWLSFGNIAGRFIKAILIIYSARVLGVAGYGTFSYILTLAAFLSLFADLGVTAIITREGAKDHTRLPFFLATAFYMKLGLSFISVLTVIFVAPFFTQIPDAMKLLPLAALLIVLDNFRDLFISIGRSQQRMEKEALINIFTYIAITISGIVALVIFSSVKSLIIGYIIGSATGTLFAFILFRHHFVGIWHHYDKTLFKKIFAEGWMFALWGLLGGIMLNTDTIMLGWLTNAQEVGYYSAAQRTILILYTIPALLASAFFPVFAKLANKDDSRFSSVFEKSIKISLMIALPMIAGGLILSYKIIQLLYGNAYTPSVTTFSILLFTVLIVFPSTFIGNAIFAYNKHKVFVGFLTLGVLSNVTLNYLLIPRFGIEGSAVATIIAQLLANGLGFIEMKKINNFKVLKYLPKIFMATIVMSILTLFLNNLGVNVVINIMISSIVYFGILYLLKESLLDKRALFDTLR